MVLAFCMREAGRLYPFHVFEKHFKHATNNFVETNGHFFVENEELGIIAFFQVRPLSLKSCLPMLIDPFVPHEAGFSHPARDHRRPICQSVSAIRRI